MGSKLISDEYKALLVQKHDDKPWGGAGHSWIPTIAPLFNRLPPGKLTCLDFGCGRGTFKRDFEQWNPDVSVVEYDPGVRGKDNLPTDPVNFVVCTDVMEHVEEEFVDDTLRMIAWYAIDGVFFNIDLQPAKSFLPDGQNTHITLKSSAWWQWALGTHIPDTIWTVHRESKSQLVISGVRKAVADVE